jgi:hypothetical protein
MAEGGQPGTDITAQNRKSHHFRTGDHVSFEAQLTDRAGKLVANKVRFLYNHELEKLIHRARTENVFKGYLKLADGKLFVKEPCELPFFSVDRSEWEKIAA